MSEAKLLHVLGGGAWQVPTIQYAKRLGYRVLVSDMYTERPGYALADYHEVVDIRDERKTLAVAERFKIDGILCDTTDAGVPTAAFVAEKLGLPGIGYETALNFTYKDRARAKSGAAGVLNPRYRLVRQPDELAEASEEVGFPLLMKPTDNQASRGIGYVRRKEDLAGAFIYARSHSKREEVLMEAFIEGTEVTVEGICIDGESHVTGISDKDHFAQRPQVACRLTYPADFPASVIAEIERTNRAVVRALGLKWGVTHAEYMVRGSQVYLVEIAARGGGNHIHTKIVPFLSGVDACRFLIENSLGSGSRPPLPRTLGRAADLEFFSFPAGIVRSIRVPDEARTWPGVEEIALEIQEGTHFAGIEDDRTRPGFVLAFGTSRAEVLSLSEKVKRSVQVVVEPLGARS